MEEENAEACCCCRCCCDNLSTGTATATGTGADTPCTATAEPPQLELFQWIGLETAELLPAYITRYYNNLHYQVNRRFSL